MGVAEGIALPPQVEGGLVLPARHHHVLGGVLTAPEFESNASRHVHHAGRREERLLDLRSGLFEIESVHNNQQAYSSLREGTGLSVRTLLQELPKVRLDILQHMRHHLGLPLD